MNLLLDTQCWLWMLAAPERFSAAARRLVSAAENELLFSAASAWEIAIKHSLGKLRLPPGPPAVVLPPLLATSGVTPLPVLHGHAFRVADLPLHHRDPFDRLLIAQAQVEAIPILTADRVFARYDVEVVKA